MTETRQIVVPGEVVGSADEFQPGQNTYQEGGDIRALRLGVKSVRGDRVNVISLSGRYEPGRGDMVIGTVVELGPSNWYISIGAANDVGMHVNDVPWRVEFGETSKYLAIGDTVLLKIVHVDEMKKAQVSMKDRQCRKLTGGLIWEVSPSKVPRIVGRNGSMIGLIKDYTSVRLFVGQNGKVWLDGEAEDVKLALEALHKIEAEAHTTGLTDRMKAWLEERRPGAADRKRAERQESEEEHEAFRPSTQRRERPKIDRSEEEAEEEAPRRDREGGHTRHHSDRRAHRGEKHHGHAEARERDERRPPRDERRGGDRDERRPMHERPMRDEPRGRPERDERPMRDEPRGRPERDERPGHRDERPPRRFEDEARPPRRDDRPPRRFDDEEPRAPRRDERPPRRFQDDEERPARRDERPARRFEEPPARKPKFDDEEEEDLRPLRRSRFDANEDEEERPARPARRVEEPRRDARAPARKPSFDDEEEDAPPARRNLRDDEDDDDDRPARSRDGGDREGGPRRRRGGRGRGSRGGRKED